MPPALTDEQLPYGSPDSPLASISRKPLASSMGGSHRAPSWPTEQAELEAARSQQAWSLWAPTDISEHHEGAFGEAPPAGVTAGSSPGDA